MAKYRAINGKLLLIKIPSDVVQKISEEALRRQEVSRSKIIREYFEWGFNAFLKNVISKENTQLKQKKTKRKEVK